MADYSIDIKKKTCITPECRGSYVNILEPGLKMKNSPLEPDKYIWSIQGVFKKTPEIDSWVKDLKNIYSQVLLDNFEKEKAGKMAELIALKKKFPLRDGDDPETTAAIKDADFLKGCYFISASNYFRQPHIIGPIGKVLESSTLTEDDIYSGAYYRLMLQFYFYSKKGNAGIASSIEAIMKTKDGERLSGGTSSATASGAFSEFAIDAAELFDGVTETATPNEKDSFSFM